MSSLNIDYDEDQRWVPTHVQVTVLRGRGLRAKGKHGTSDVYTIIQVGKEKYSTCVLEKTTVPEWKEECSFELLPGVLEQVGDGGAYPPGSSDLVLTVMHRALMGLDVFLGQAVIPLDKVFQDRICMKNEWYKLNSKTGKKEKERGDIQVTVQFTKNNLTASMYDLSLGKDKPRSTFGKIKDRIKGKKRSSKDSDEDSASTIGGGYGPVSRMRNRLPSDGGGEEDYEDDEGGEGRRSKMRNFFLRGKLRKSSDTRSSTSLGSESSESSSRGGSLSPTAGISVVVSDLSNSPSNSSNFTADSPDHTAESSPKLASYTCEFTDESGEINIPVPQPVCINGSHVYNTTLDPCPGNPVVPLDPLALVKKNLPLSQSLQNLNQRREELPVLLPKGPAADGRRWSFDKAGKEEKVAIAAALEQAGQGMGEGAREESDRDSRSRNCLDESEQASNSDSGPGEKHKGWFGSKDNHNKPSPHPVKPLTPEEKRRAELSEGRSVLDKLKSSIHPGRSSQPTEQQPEKKKSLTEGAGPYYHLTHSELVALLLQREGDLHPAEGGV
ncbi:rab11 family-interacting protein 5 isoform X3 [Oncorhynchus kisutch]|uniref:rab11 family-interacting protein 5 isoform X3 n=1 Tax=Oncorhynchus kisutch TaxID=8019 RepID=UPI0012DE7F0B|nr:rab11 family-interacting protein 5 isoform X3 [Oncorhynchus kisutch]